MVISEVGLLVKDGAVAYLTEEYVLKDEPMLGCNVERLLNVGLGGRLKGHEAMKSLRNR